MSKVTDIGKILSVVLLSFLFLTVPSQAALPEPGALPEQAALLEQLALFEQAAMFEKGAFPEHFDFGENYYTVYGGPYVSVIMLGDNEFSRGDTVTVSINLMNKGVVTGFKSEKESDTDLEQKLQQTEMKYEAQRTTAIGILAALVSLDPAVKVKSGPQEAGTLLSGEQTENPIEFTVEIANNAPDGTYPLVLYMLYGYQKNVQIDGDNETDLGITNLEVGLWYDVMSQNQTILINVKEEPRFEIMDVKGELRAGEEGLLYVTYKNTGKLRAKDATVRISASDPFSTTDDQAFIGSLAPGESAVALFNLKVDDTATPKMYAINSEIKYEDVDGHDQISDTLKIRTETLPAIPTSEKLEKFKGIVYILVLVLLIGVGVRLYRNYQDIGTQK